MRLEELTSYAAQHMTGIGTVTIADETLREVAFQLGRRLTSVMLAVKPDAAAPEKADTTRAAEVHAVSAAEAAGALGRFIASIVAGVPGGPTPQR